MNFTVAALLGLTLAQAPIPDYYPYKTRTIEIPVAFKKDSKIRQALLFVARNGENTWYQESEVTPDKSSFIYTAKDDGIYWFKVVTVDMQGKKDPPDVTKDIPDLKVLIDTIPPMVRFTTARRTGDEVVIEWAIDDKHPDESQTQVFFKPLIADGAWKEVRLHPTSRGGVRFSTGTNDPVVVRVTVQDLAGNKGEGSKEIGSGALTPATTTTSLSSPPPAPPNLEVPVPDSRGPGPVSFGPVGTPRIPEPIMPAVAPAPVSPSGLTPPAPSLAFNPTPAPAPSYTHPVPAPSYPGPTPIASGQGMTPTPAPTYTPMQSNETRLPLAQTGGQGVIAASNATLAPAPETQKIQTINYMRFDLAYKVEQTGPSGVKHVDLWVTRDDGRTWTNWSQHDGRELPIRVQLDGKPNSVPEGLYGFRLVPMSGAGLSEPTPIAGEAPDMRVVVDLTPPNVTVFEPISDPAQREVLLLQWKATDKNFADDPISIEWSERATGPWQSVIASDGIVRVNALESAGPRRIANDGQYRWRVPTGLPPKVYLKVSARDAAGNVTEVITPNPITVDLNRPRARINGIITTPVLARP